MHHRSVIIRYQITRLLLFVLTVINRWRHTIQIQRDVTISVGALMLVPEADNMTNLMDYGTPLQINYKYNLIWHPSVD